MSNDPNEARGTPLSTDPASSASQVTEPSDEEEEVKYLYSEPITLPTPDLRRDLNLQSEHLGNSIEILYLPLLKNLTRNNKYWIASFSGSSCDQGSFRVTRSTNGRGFRGQWASELSTSLWDGKCREGMRSVTGEELSPLVGQLVSHWEDGSLGRKGGVGREKNILTRTVLGDLKN
ncbi:hypothetical protein TNCV_4563841 [Trichonephila clavipes]|uniref:Uncharacterized protein n=1 Tax=Trichonephila clavipes TaxID=2585209 RepID=A0A8X6W4U1_TRICX|nr:hypothetical protein TNCV_4563841 [Trichonephila clavipes]